MHLRNSSGAKARLDRSVYEAATWSCCTPTPRARGHVYSREAGPVGVEAHLQSSRGVGPKHDLLKRTSKHASKKHFRGGRPARPLDVRGGPVAGSTRSPRTRGHVCSREAGPVGVEAHLQSSRGLRLKHDFLKPTSTNESKKLFRGDSW